MRYPTMDEVEKADREKLARWYRFLPGPGSGTENMSMEDFHRILGEQSLVLNRICERFRDMGMFTPELSKLIGWDRP